jgi:hypothetical protein
MNPTTGVGKLRVKLISSSNGWHWVISTVVGSKTIAIGRLCKTRDSARVAARNAIRSIKAVEERNILWE